MQHAIDVLNTRLGILGWHDALSSDFVELENIQAQKDSLALAILELELPELEKLVKEQREKIESQKRRCAISKSRTELAEEGYRFISRDESPEEGDEMRRSLDSPWEPATNKYGERYLVYLIRRKIS